MHFEPRIKQPCINFNHTAGILKLDVVLVTKSFVLNDALTGGKCSDHFCKKMQIAFS